MITKFTRIILVDKEIHFPSKMTSQPLQLGHHLIYQIFKKQHLSNRYLKAKVVSLSGINQSTRYGQLKKQDIIVADPTTYIKLVLWENYVDTLQLNKIYAKNNVRVKFAKSADNLKTQKNEEIKAAEVRPYTIPLVDYKDEVSTLSTVNRKNLDVQKPSSL